MVIPNTSIYPPVNGGMQRCFHIFHQLCRNFEVTLISRQGSSEFEEAIVEYPALANATFLNTKESPKKKDIFSLLPKHLQFALRYRWYKKSISGSADLLFLEYYQVLKSVLACNSFDYVILENLSTINSVSVIRKFSPNTKIVYDAHNVDSNLALASGNQYFEIIKRVESSLHNHVDGIIACSKSDLVDFRNLNNHHLYGTVIPNGVQKKHINDDDKIVNKAACKSIIFCGSLDYKPNSEGLLWFYKNVWGKIKDSVGNVQLLVVGSGKRTESLDEMSYDDSVTFTGRVDDVNPYYRKASVAIVPILRGSGTRLKVLEAMALGVPVVSTSKGAEGIECDDEKNILIADNADGFARQILSLFGNVEKSTLIQQHAYRLIDEKYNWDIIGNSLNNFLASLNNKVK